MCDYFLLTPIPLSLLLCLEELAATSSRVLTLLPERENLKKAVRRVKRKNLPANPSSLDELDDIPRNLQVTATGDRFLMYDSHNTHDFETGRVIVFGTRRNLELLLTSRMWYLDGTFKVAPSIFTQVFTGTCNKNLFIYFFVHDRNLEKYFV